MDTINKEKKRYVLLALVINVFKLAYFDKKIVKEMVRYGFAGLAPATLDFVLIYLLKSIIGLNYLLAAPLAFIAGLWLSYILNIRYIFVGYYKNERLPIVLIIYIAIGIIGLLLNEQAMWLGVGAFGLNYLVAKLIADVFVTIWNFLAKKWFLFNNHIAAKIEKRIQDAFS